MAASSLSAPDNDSPVDWPRRERSHRLLRPGIAWGLTREGEGPLLLLLHGTGGSSHSWAPCIPALARHCTVLTLDLPGHGFTRLLARPAGTPDPLALRGMAAAVADVLQALDARPTVVAGHSAGVPLLLRLILDGAIAPERVVGICPALVPPEPLLQATLGAPLAALATAAPVARAGAWLARTTGVVPAMLASTGSPLTPAQAARYAWLCTDPARVHAALAMMARWDLPGVLRDAHALRVPVTLLAGARDRWVPLAALRRAVERFLPQASLAVAPGGHLLPEEDPARVVAAILGAPPP
ncbi:MAG: alpha/beta fold hydrolase [Gemmatimonadetes bacterium]|nr:alpha/beta fold hydrolase [Gemmatimonadota bacterium]